MQRRRKSFSSGREGKKEEKEEQEEEKGEGGRGTERKGEISRRKIRGEHVKEGKNISRRVVPPPSPPPCRSSRSGASNGEKRKGRGGGREREGRSERKTRRNGPTAQQKRDKSSTLIRILPLFALWNTILNGMGAQ